MPSASALLAVESENISFTNLQAKEANFEAKCKYVSFYSTAAVHVAFDSVANSGSYFIPASTHVDFQGPIEFTKISAIGDATTGTLYILVRR